MTYTVIMIIMICIGCAAALAGLVILAYRGIVLMKAAQRIGLGSLDQVRGIVRRVEELTPRMEAIAARQKEVAERLEHLSATTAKLNYLRDELDAATGHVSSLKS